MIIGDNKSMQETQLGHSAPELGRSTSKGDTFVKAVGRKARSFLKSLERSFSSSTTDREEDVSCMTIEFLYVRLQAQHTIYNAEKQQVQQLVKKVMELEQKLKLEIARRKKAECENISSRYGSCYLRTKDSPYCNRGSCMMNKEGKEKGVIVGSSLVEAGSCYTSEHHENQIDEGTVRHTDGGEVYHSCLCHQCECHRSNCQQWPFQHWSLLDKQSNDQNSSETSMQKGTRESVDSEPYSKEKKANIMLEMAGRSLNAKDDTYGADSWSNVYKIDTEDLEENEYKSLNFQRMPGLTHRFPPRKAMSFRQLASNSSLDCLSLGSSRNLASGGTSRDLLRKCSVRAVNSLREYHERTLEGIMSSPKKMNLGAFTDLSISSPSLQERSLYNNRQVPKCSLHEDIVADSESSKEIEEDGHVARQKRKQDFEGEHVMVVHPSRLT